MRWARTLIPTLREDPAEAETPSHKLMVRAGLIRKLSAGVYSYLPLGARALLKATQIVREEMNRAGAVEVYLPVMHPPELWQESGRYEAWGDELFRLKDRHGRVNVLGPTHEEVITHLVRNEVSSYRQLPITLFQIQVKLRDEPRPRSGVIRAREFIMKDAYSFDVTEEGLDREYQQQYDAYCRIFNRAELNYLVTEADPGLMGGRGSHEFMVPSLYGEDEMTRCPKCKYCANATKAECVEQHGRVNPQEAPAQMLPLEAVATPGLSTVEEVGRFLNVAPQRIVKTLILRTEKGFAAALLRGDHELNPTKLSRVLGASVLEMASAAEVEKVSRGAFGFSGPVGLDVPLVADLAIEHMHDFVVGANRKDTHYAHANLHRDFKPSLFGDIRMAQPGDLCSRCMAPLDFIKAIEVGHIFKLGTRYSEKMKALFKNERGEARPMIMGCYGIGVNRIVACAIECHHDANGIRWPRELAPYAVDLVSVNARDEAIARAAESAYQKLMAAGVEVLWDDRDVTPGVKFVDADLIGFPLRITVGKKTAASGTVDLRLRNKEGESPVSLDTVVEAAKNALREYRLSR